jgi:16S rRNA (uracil1498-N3)-methyltransferase
MVLLVDSSFKGPVYNLNKEDSGHVARVLRLQQGDKVTITRGDGIFHHCEILMADNVRTTVKLIESEAVTKSWPGTVTIAMAPTKNISRTEWAVEKMTEIGVDRIVPLLCEHSERKIIKPARLMRVIHAAMKQSLKAHQPELEPMTPFGHLIEQAEKAAKYIAYVDKFQEVLLAGHYTAGKDVVILIGPEGDFSPDEIKLATQAGFQPVSLGNSRLRTETAAIAACHTIHVINQTHSQ